MERYNSLEVAAQQSARLLNGYEGGLSAGVRLSEESAALRQAHSATSMFEFAEEHFRQLEEATKYASRHFETQQLAINRFEESLLRQAHSARSVADLAQEYCRKLDAATEYASLHFERQQLAINKFIERREATDALLESFCAHYTDSLAEHENDAVHSIMESMDEVRAKVEAIAPSPRPDELSHTAHRSEDVGTGWMSDSIATRAGDSAEQPVTASARRRRAPEEWYAQQPPEVKAFLLFALAVVAKPALQAFWGVIVASHFEKDLQAFPVSQAPQGTELDDASANPHLQFLCVSASSLIVRAESNKGADRIGSIDGSDFVERLEEQGNYTFVRYKVPGETHTLREGWVATEHLKPYLCE